MISTSPFPDAPQNRSPSLGGKLIIPELLEMISRSLPKRDAFHLAQSSRLCYFAAVGQIWYSLEDSLHLFRLLPGFSSELFDSGTSMTFPELSTCDLARFDFYASLVKHFARHDGRIEFLSNPATFLPYLKRGALLPNLQGIEFPAGLSMNDIFWLHSFLSPSVRVIKAGPSLRRDSVEPEVTFYILGQISVLCPKLRALSLYHTSHARYVPFKLLTSPDWLFYGYVGFMHNLRVLRATTDVLEAPALRVIGTLQRLEKLIIHGTISPALLLQLPTTYLPSDSFPALHTLKLSTLLVEDFKAVWRMRQSVKGLVTVSLHFDEPYADRDLVTLVIYMSINSPRLTSLRLDFIDGTMNHLSPDIFWPLRSLPLEQLTITKIHLPSPMLTCQMLSYGCPSLRSLKTGTWLVSVPELRYFAHLSQLEYLQAGVDWESCMDLDQMDSELNCVSRSFRRLEWTTDPGTSVEPRLIRKTVTFLLSFWPELSSVRMKKGLHLDDLKRSTPWLVDDHLQAERAVRRCRCDVCLGRIVV